MAIPDINVMCDMETMGVKPGSIILSIALVPFYTEYVVEPFYCKIDIQSSIEAGFLPPDEATMKWWGELPPAVFEEATTGGIPVLEAFNKMIEYYKSLPGTPITFGNGSDFDNVLLHIGFQILNLPSPLNHKNNACYRTIARLFKDKVNYIKPTMSHSALADAQAQAQRCELMFKLLDEMFSLYEPKTTELNVVRRLDSILTADDLVQVSELQKDLDLIFVENPADTAAEPTSAYVNQDQ